MDYVLKIVKTVNDSPLLKEIALILILACLALIVYFIFEKIVIRTIEKLIQKTETQWDNVLYKNKVFHPLVYIAPAVIIFLGSHFTTYSEDILKRASLILIIINVFNVVNKSLSSLNLILKLNIKFKSASLTAMIQIGKILVIIIGLLAIVSVIINRSPAVIIGGFGAFAAILLLVFRETILSIIASIQIQMNDMVRIGDWIEMPQYGVDGDVVEMALHTVKVQNWDKTIATIPTYKLVVETVKNWRGMSEAGGRRIKRAILIDQNSIKICDKRLLEKVKNIHLLKDYINGRIKEINKHNKKFKTLTKINGRALTNIGLYRNYIKNYLRNHPKIHNNMTFLVRQLAPDSQRGLPLEVYVFTNDTVWANYEEIQSDIFDHLLAVLPEFELKTFQRSAATVKK